MERDIPTGHQFLAEANGIEICYSTTGDIGSRPLVFINGLGSQMINWQEDFCAQFVARGYGVIRFDNRDAGLSSRFGAAGTPDIEQLLEALEKGQEYVIPYTLRDMADDAIGLLDALGIESAHFLGSSMGGRIGQMIAIHHPGRIRTLTTVMSTMGEPGYPPPNPDARSMLFTPAPNDRAGFTAYYVELSRVLSGPAFGFDESAVREQAGRAYDRSFNPGGVTRQLAAYMAAGSTRDRLRSVKTPTLVIHGREDPLIPVGCARDMADTIPNAKLLVVKGMGHAISDAPQVWPPIIEAVARHALEIRGHEMIKFL